MPKPVTQNGVTRIVANPEPKGKRKVELLRDHTLTYPDLFFSIFVAGDWDVREDEARFARMFARAGCKRAKSPLEADLIVFGGGSDVSPYLYGEEPHASTFANEKRDEQDMDLYLLALEHGIPMLGVCRGMQFLHVMNGGKLYQDVDKHVGEHPIYDLRNRSFIDKVSSVHHQMCRPNPDMMIIATNNYARNRWCNPKERHIGPRADIEAFYYPETVCIGVQGHPEYDGVPYFTKWVIELIEELVVMNPDIDWIDGNRRIKPDLLAMRPKKAKASVVGYPTDGCNSELIAAMKMVRD